MAKVISQETFNDVVQENIVDFSMSSTEAKEETIKQFEAQGINLSNIIKDLTINEETGKPILNDSIEKIRIHVSGDKKLDKNEIMKILEIIESECKKSVPHRVLAGKLDANNLIISIIEEQFLPALTIAAEWNDVIIISLKCGSALTNKHPDIFDEKTLLLIIKILDNLSENTEIISATLQWLSKACILHEMNRQSIMNAGIINCVKPFIAQKNPQIIRDTCTVFRNLVLDDDIRVEFGKAHEHARLIAIEYLVDLTKLLEEFDDTTLISELLLTIATLTVRHEFCVVIEEAGGLKSVLKLITKYPDDLKLNKEALKLLRALAGNDKVKMQIIQQGGAPVIQTALDKHKDNEILVKTALHCVSALTLRVKENSVAFFETNIPETIIECMKLHPTSKGVQRNSAWSIRNMVSRLREYNDAFLSNDAETLLNLAMEQHPSILHDIKSALRDLNCKVDLKEEWTGKSTIKMEN